MWLKSKTPIPGFIALILSWMAVASAMAQSQQVTLGAIVTRSSQTAIKQILRPPEPIKTTEVDWISGSVGLRFTLRLGTALNPEKSEASFTSTHFDYQDNSGQWISKHPQLSEVRSGSLVFDITANPPKDKILGYPTIDYEVVEYY